MNLPADEGARYVDAGAVTVAIASVFGWLPNIAALLTVIWMIIRIWETETVRSWVRKEQASHEASKLRAAERQVQAEVNVVEKAKEELKPVVVQEVIQALPLDPLVTQAIKEKVLAPNQELNADKKELG